MWLGAQGVITMSLKPVIRFVDAHVIFPYEHCHWGIVSCSRLFQRVLFTDLNISFCPPVVPLLCSLRFLCLSVIRTFVDCLRLMI